MSNDHTQVLIIAKRRAVRVCGRPARSIRPSAISLRSWRAISQTMGATINGPKKLRIASDCKSGPLWGFSLRGADRLLLFDGAGSGLSRSSNGLAMQLSLPCDDKGGLALVG